MMNKGIEKERILFIGPHPDDVFISAAGFILKNATQYKFDIVCMCGHGLSDTYKVRIEEEKKAWNQITKLSGASIELSFCEIGADTQLFKVKDQLIRFIEDRVRQTSYKYIFAPYFQDTHQDHQTVAEAVLAASRYQNNIIFYETPSSISFHPTLFVEIKESVVNNKIVTVAQYQSVSLFGNINNYQENLGDYIEAKLLSNGALSRVCKWAEGFLPYRMIL